MGNDREKRLDLNGLKKKDEVVDIDDI